MVRRCQFLENCPALRLNEGRGPPIFDENGKNTGKYADITKLRSTLLRKMLEEVTKFCNRDMVKSWNQQSHQQVTHSKNAYCTIFFAHSLIFIVASFCPLKLIYDFKDGGSTFGLLSLNANLDQSDHELFVKLGIEMHSIM